MRVPGGATARRLAARAVRSSMVPNRHRHGLYRRLGLRSAEDAWFSSGVRILDPRATVMGAGCFLNEEVFIDRGGVTLGANVYMGPRAMVITADHAIGSPELRAGPGAPRPVFIGDGTWIGAGAVILPGVSIGPGCIVAAGAVVTGDLAPNGLYAGVPAIRKKDLPGAGEQ